MKRGPRKTREPVHPRPVERIELNESNTTRRLVFTVAFLVFGVMMLAYAFYQFLTPQTEWIHVEVNSSVGASCADEFDLLYHLSGGRSAREEQRAVTAVYSQLCHNALEVFHNQLEVEGVNNLWAINRHPNEELVVDGALYEAFSVVERSGSRLLYLGPVYDRYGGVFYCEGDWQLVDFDPWSSEEVAREYLEYTRFANDPQSVRVELLGEDRIRLFVSQEYLDYAAREGVESFIDFAWMRNAFVTDYIARELAGQGYSRGVLCSYDGFARCMDASGEEYSLNLHDRQGQTVYVAAELRYQGPMSIVSLRDYPVSGQDADRFYRTESGEIRVPYVDPVDGRSRTAVPNLACYAGDKGCGEILLEMAPVYIAEDFQKDALAGLEKEGIASIYCEDRVIYPSERDAVLTQIYEGENMSYRVEQ